MSLESILELIQTKGEDQVKQIMDQAEKTAHEILLKARREADRVRREKLQEEAAKANLQRYRLINSAQQSSQQQIGEAREKFIAHVFQQAGEQLAQTRNRDDYPLILEELIDEAVVEMNESRVEISSCRLLIDPRDRELVNRYLAQKSLKLNIEANEQNWGGVVLLSQDGRVAVINTIESRFELAKPYLRKTVSRFLQS